MPVLHLPPAYSPKTKTIFQDRQSRCRHFIQALVNFNLLSIIQDTLLAYTWDTNDNHDRDQYSKVGLHSDSEDLFLARSVPSTIISISLGAARTFVLQANDGSASYSIDLEHGDIATMEGLCQRDYRHALLPAKHPCGPRINLTFRKIVQHKQYCSLAQS